LRLNDVFVASKHQPLLRDALSAAEAHFDAADLFDANNVNTL
jgi:hypothetical protein